MNPLAANLTADGRVAAPTSLWPATVDLPQFAALDRDLAVDVCIVGAGIAGLSTAYELIQAGKSVAVVERRELTAGDTRMTTAHLSNALDDRFTEIERIHGSDAARLAAESHGSAIDRIEEIVDQEGIDCDFQRVAGYLMLADKHPVKLLDDELAAARRAGLSQVEKLDRAPFTFWDTGPCLCFPRQAQFHPLKYLAALARVIAQKGGQIFTDSHAKKIAGGEPAKLEANGFTVTANAMVVATNTPINDLVAIHTKQAPYTTYAIAAPVPRGSVPRMLLWDTLDAYHYVRLQEMKGNASHELLIVGGADHKTGQADDYEQRHARLETWARRAFPMMGQVQHTWSGQVMETVDGLAFIGKNPMDEENVFIATGDSGMGITHGAIAGMLIRDLILGHHNPWAELYDPSRKPLKALGEYVKEQLNVAAQYGQWVTGGDVADDEEIPAGEGAIVRSKLSKLAVYRDEDGEAHRCTAVCPHLGCIVQWNTNEKTWDCPCHGSRFDARGRLLHGPANSDLESMEG